MKIKYSFVINEKNKIDCINASDKILAMSLATGEIILKNLFTYDTIQIITNYESFPQKINHINFLIKDSCEYFLACSTSDGKILLLTSIIQEKKVKNLTIKPLIQKEIIKLASNKEYLVAVSDEQKVSIYLLRSMKLKFTVYIPSSHFFMTGIN